MTLMPMLMGRVIGPISIMPQNLLRCHPFVGKSFFDVTLHDDKDVESCGQGSDSKAEEVLGDVDTGDATDASGVCSGVSQGTHGREVCSDDQEGRDLDVEHGEVSLSRATFFNRMPAIIVEDCGAAVPASFFASRSVRPSEGPISGRGTDIAITVPLPEIGFNLIEFN